MADRRTIPSQGTSEPIARSPFAGGVRVMVSGESRMPGVTKVSSHAAAAKDLADTPYLVYCLAQCAKLFLKLIEKRWPEMA